MNLMKKILIPVLCICAAVSVTGCRASRNTSSSGTSSGTASTALWPVKTLEIICPDSTGTGSDLRSRILAPYLEKELGITVVVTSKSGGGSTLASQACMDAPNDGSLMMMMHNAMISTKVWGTVDYDHRDMKIVSNLFSDNTSLISANKQSGIKTFKDLVDRSKQDPGSISTVCDIGSIIYLEVSSMEKALGIRFTKADAGGITERIAAVVGGHADTVILSYKNIQSYVEAGELIPLAVVGVQRIEAMPDLPTIIETGYDFFWPSTLLAAFLPPGTDDSLVQTMDAALAKIANDPGFIQEVIKTEGINMIRYQPTVEAFAVWEEARVAQEEAYAALAQ